MVLVSPTTAGAMLASMICGYVLAPAIRRIA
jgi:hypothetical protein